MKIDFCPRIGALKLKNPLLVASGTFGFGHEYSPVIDPSLPGAIVTKTITLKERPGNPSPRMVETPSGLLNSIGLQNPGVDRFLKEELPLLRPGASSPIIVSVGGNRANDYVEVVRRLNPSGIHGIELNISCPNLSPGGRGLIGQSATKTFQVVSSVRGATHLPLIVKLTPLVTDIEGVAISAWKGGADAVSCINTIPGMVFDSKTGRPALAAKTGGLSGPAVRPIAILNTYLVSRAVPIPVIGMGGIETTEDALQFFLAGAKAVAMGTALFSRPSCLREVIEGLKRYRRGKRG